MVAAVVVAAASIPSHVDSSTPGHCELLRWSCCFDPSAVADWPGVFSSMSCPHALCPAALSGTAVLVAEAAVDAEGSRTPGVSHPHTDGGQVCVASKLCRRAPLCECHYPTGVGQQNLMGQVDPLGRWPRMSSQTFFEEHSVDEHADGERLLEVAKLHGCLLVLAQL